MKNLELKKNYYGLRVNCSKCDRHYNYNKVTTCKHGKDSQTYKSVVYYEGRTKVKHFDTQDYNEALILAINFKKEVKNGALGNMSEQDFLKPEILSVIEAANAFLRFKHGIDVPSHMKRNLSKSYLKNIQYVVGQFIEVLNSKGLNPKSMPISQVGPKHVGYWYDMITARYSKGSWNGYIKILRLWFSHIIDREKILMYNPFLDVTMVEVDNDIQVITNEEFLGVCDAVYTKNPFQQLGGKAKERKSHFKPYLVDAFRLALQCGLRGEEIWSLQWKDIHKINSSRGFIIITDNLKVERMMNRKYKKKYIPVHAQLEKLLIELGWKDFQGSSQYILEPFRKVQVETLMANCSKGWGHFYKEAFPGREHRPFKTLRKTYLTYLGREVGDETIHFSSHSGVRVLQNHYFDPKLMAKALKMEIFS